jgi:serine/threonine-protein kinase HipA
MMPAAIRTDAKTRRAPKPSRRKNIPMSAAHHGNADAHAKNLSVLHEPGSPAIRLAPMYDVVSTIALELTDSTEQPLRADTHLGQRVGGQADIRKVTAASLIDEATAWGIRRRAASAVVTETLDRVLTAIPATPGDERVLAAIRGQAERISRG